MAANLEREWKASIEDSDKLLGSTTYAKPKLTEDTIKMLMTVSTVAIKLAGDQLCIALMRYMYAAELMRFHDHPIAVNMNRLAKFLVSSYKFR